MPGKLLEGQQDDRPDILVNLLLTDNDDTPIPKLAEIAGYSKSYANGINSRLINTEGFQRKLVQAYKAGNSALLPKALKIRTKAFDKYLEDPLLAINKPKLLESVDRITGVIQDEHAPQAPTINVKVLANNLSINLDTPQGGKK